MAGLKRKLWLAFGLWLPIVCFAIDSYAFNVYGGWSSCVYWFVALELALFARYAWSVRRSDFEQGALLAAFLLGALFALVTAVLLAPTAVVGVLFLIGPLGLVPWGTLVAFSVAAAQLLTDRAPRNWPLQVSGALIAASVLFVPPTLWRRHQLEVGRAALDALENHNDCARAAELLAGLPYWDTSCLPLKREFERLLRADLPRWIQWHWTDFVQRFPSHFD